MAEQPAALNADEQAFIAALTAQQPPASSLLAEGTTPETSDAAPGESERSSGSRAEAAGGDSGRTRPQAPPPASRWPDPERGQIAEIPAPLYDAWDYARKRLAAWKDAADDMDTQIRELIGAATVITVEGRPVLRRHVARHENVSYTSDDLRRWPKRADDE